MNSLTSASLGDRNSRAEDDVTKVHICLRLDGFMKVFKKLNCFSVTLLVEDEDFGCVSR
jgi:hypothetical protein